MNKLKSESNRKSLDYMEIVFENTDSITIPADNIGGFYFGKISSYRAMYPNYTPPNLQIERGRCADCIRIRLKPSANRDYYEFKMESHEEYKTLIFDRLQINDICIIELHYTDSTSEAFDVIWHKNDEYVNRYQKTKIKDGFCSITIKKRKKKHKKQEKQKKDV